VPLARIGVVLLVAGCCDPTFIIDTFPVPVDLAGGVPILAARAAELAGGPLRVVLDTSAPVTILDEGAGVTSRRRLELELLRGPPPPAGLPVMRASFQCVPALISPVGAVGAGAPDDVAGVIGGDVLSRVALRLEAGKGQVRFFPDVAGDDATHEDACTAVMRVTLAGGGRFIAGNDVVDFPPSRIVVGACLAPDAEGGTAPSGADTLLVVATGVGPTVLSRTTARAALGLDDAAIDALPQTRVYLPGDTQLFGEVARVTRVPRMALTGRVEGRGPCAELFVSREVVACPADQLVAGACTRSQLCTQGTCAAAAVELSGEVEVAIVADTHPHLQALRNELRPEIADVGGLLGMAALGPLVVDLDYPSSRVLVRCAAPGAGCVARPRVGGPGAAREVELRGKGCL
jgi:hypothetical protein